MLLTFLSARLVSAELATGADPFLVILTNGGVIGAILILTMFGKGLHTHDAYQQLEKRNTEQAQVIERLMTLLEVKVVPALGKSTQVYEASINRDAALTDRLDAWLDRVEKMAREEE